MNVSIIVPTYNEEKDIEVTLDALVDIRYPNKEIIVVDDSADNTPNIVKRYEDLGVKLIHRDKNTGGRAGARNRGIRESIGDVIVILNADVQLPPDFIDKILVHYEAGYDYVLVESKVSNEEFLLARIVQAQHAKHYYHERDYDKAEWTEGFSCRREAALDVGMFFDDALLTLIAGVDGHFGEKLAHKGYRKKVDLSIVVPHIGPSDFKNYWHTRKGRGTPLTAYFVYKQSLRKIIYNSLILTITKVFEFGTVIPALIKCFRLTAFSSKGRLDVIPFFFAYALQEVAILTGRWQGICKLIKYISKSKKKDSKLKIED